MRKISKNREQTFILIALLGVCFVADKKFHLLERALEYMRKLLKRALEIEQSKTQEILERIACTVEARNLDLATSLRRKAQTIDSEW